MVTIEEAARRLGLSDHAVRRRIRRGALYAVREERPQGFAWLVGFEGDRPSLPPVDAEVAPDSAQVPPGGDQVAGALIEALRLNEKLQVENRELAGRVGYLMGQVEELRGQLLLTAGTPEKAPDAARGRWFWSWKRPKAVLPG